MTRLVCLFLSLVAISLGGEVGLKLGNSRLYWNDLQGTSTRFDGYVGLQVEKLFMVSESVGIGPSVELGYGAKKIGRYTCQNYGDCKVDLTYTTLELNLKNLFKVSFLEIFLGGGVSRNRLALDARDINSDKYIGTVAEETGTGTQVFVGAQVIIKFLGLGVEYKYKNVGVPSVKAVDVATLNLFLRW